MLQPIYGGALARPFETHFNALDRTMYLRIATELYLKRLIVGGLERVYEIGKDFRNEGLSPKHNPEFTMLEWYEAYADWEVVAERAERLVRTRRARPSARTSSTQPWKRETLAGSIQARDGHRRARPPLAGGAAGRDARARAWRSPRRAQLGGARRPPGVQARRADADRADDAARLSRRALAVRQAPPRARRLVERFEAFADGMEFANAFSELNDPDDQRARFEEQVRHAAAGDENAPPFDRTTSTRSSTGCRRRAGSASGSTALSCC